MSNLLAMFIEFFKTGLFAVGGGMATLPFLYSMADRFPWITRESISDMIAISESTPGPIGVNMATYTGFTAEGICGALVATAGLILPSVIVILIIAHFLEKFRKSFLVESAFYGIRPAVAALIALAAAEVLKTCIFSDGAAALFGISVPSVVIIGIFLVLIQKTKWHPIIFIAAAAVIGIVFKL